MRGYLIEGNGIDIDVAINYIDLPLFFSYELDTGESSALGLYGGPVLSYVVSTHAKSELYSSRYEGDLQEYNEFDFALSLGLYYDIALEGIPLNFDLRYTQGTLDWSKVGDSETLNRTFTATIGYPFSL
jgi:hypothetical protein